MKKVLLLFLPVLMAATIIDVYSDLGVDEAKAKEYLTNSIVAGYLIANYEVVSKAKALPVEMRVSAMKELMKMAKEYTSSEQFKADYKKWRNAKLNPDEKTKLGLPKFGKIISNKIDNALDKEKNDKMFPADAQTMVKQRLEDFLSISKTVDFDAELSGRRFKNPKYERESTQWKMCYRAGREVVAAAQKEAESWLQELQ